MRLIVCVLACVGIGGLAVALADPPSPNSTPAAATPAAPTAAEPAAASPATAAAAANSATGAPAHPADAAPAATATPSSSVVITGSQMEMMEKHFLSEGYKAEMRGGQKMFCRREEQMGTHLGGQKVCSTVEQLTANEAQAKEMVQRYQRQQAMGPSGK